MKYVLIQRPGDKERIMENIASFRKKTDAELIKGCEEQRKLGIVGVHAQALSLVALRYVMKERSIDCPIVIEDNIVVGFKEEA
jgi:hypothetical protein